jgi:hypothetical protein
LPGVDDAVLDELYAAPLDEFIALRTSLAKQLKADGRGDEAAEVAALKKPSVPLWAVNQLARRNRPAVDALLEASQDLRDAIGKGEREAFSEAQARQGEALRRLRDAAELLLGTATAPTLDRVVSTFRSASIDEELRPLLEAGRLGAEPEPGGFDALAGLTFAAPKRGRPAPKKRGESLAKAKAALDEAKKRHRELERTARAAEQDAEKKRAAADEAADAVAAAEADLESARGAG